MSAKYFVADALRGASARWHRGRSAVPGRWRACSRPLTSLSAITHSVDKRA